jgi:hypothetical protein
MLFMSHFWTLWVPSYSWLQYSLEEGLGQAYLKLRSDLRYIDGGLLIETKDLKILCRIHLS